MLLCIYFFFAIYLGAEGALVGTDDQWEHSEHFLIDQIVALFIGKQTVAFQNNAESADDTKCMSVKSASGQFLNVEFSGAHLCRLWSEELKDIILDLAVFSGDVLLDGMEFTFYSTGNHWISSLQLLSDGVYFF